MRKLFKKTLVTLVIIIAALSLIPFTEISSFMQNLELFKVNPSHFLIVIYIYLIITTECDIYAILTIARTKWVRDKVKRKNSKTSWKHSFNSWGFVGIFFFSCLPFLGMIAIIIYTAMYTKTTTRGRVVGRMLIYIGYIVRLLWTTSLLTLF